MGRRRWFTCRVRHNVACRSRAEHPPAPAGARIEDHATFSRPKFAIERGREKRLEVENGGAGLDDDLRLQCRRVDRVVRSAVGRWYASIGAALEDSTCSADTIAFVKRQPLGCG